MAGPPPPPPKPGLPRRPTFTSGLPQREEVPAPRSISLLMWLTRLNVLLFLVPSLVAGLDHERVRKRLREELSATDSAADYSAGEIAKAVNASLVTIAVIGLLMCLFELSAAKKLRERSSSARMTLILLAIVHLPIVVLISAMRVGGVTDISLTFLQLVVLLTILGITLLRGIKRWLGAKPPLTVEKVTINPYVPPSVPPMPPPRTPHD